MCENLSKDLSNWFNHLLTASPSLWVLSELVVSRPGSGPPTATPENRKKLLLHVEVGSYQNKRTNHPTCAGDKIIFQQPPLAVLTCQACVHLVAAAGGGGGGAATASSESSEVV